MTQVLVNEASLQDIASAIREKNESAETYKPAQMGDAIRALKSGIDVNDAPAITFDGKWQKWFVEFYEGDPYWEAWFFTSGTLNVDGAYNADAWGIGGGGFEYNGYGGGSGFTNMVLGIMLSGAIPITIGAGGYYPKSNGQTAWRLGGTTSLGSLLSCTGGGTTAGVSANTCNGGSRGSDTAGSAGINGTPGDGHLMCRFRDPDKTGEAGCNTNAKGGNGWQHVRSSKLNGEGYGAGYGGQSSYYAGNDVHACAGALVIRIKI